MQRHKTFISYHHNDTSAWNTKSDIQYREEFESICSSQFDIMVSKSVQDGDISSLSSSDNTHRIIRDKYLRNSTVTVVLIGNDTWQRKHVDWEISSSLRETSFNSRSGLIGIILPSFNHKTSYNSWSNHNNIKLENSNYAVSKNQIPERLAMNIDNGFAKIYDWSGSPYNIQEWIHDAYERKNKIIPDNSLTMFSRNK